MSSKEPTPPDSPLGWQAAIGWTLNNQVIAFLFALVVAGAGLYVSPFSWGDGQFPRDPIPVDAIPDIGENQQIVFTEWPGRSPRDVEDQISYPLTTALLGMPGVRTVRSSSALGFSTIYVIFQDDIEFYWSRSRVLEKLASLAPGTVPEGVSPTLGPDATALGQVFWYTLEGQDRQGKTVGGWDLDELRTIQDWTVRYALQSVEGVSEVASVGGFVREYQIDVDPEAMRAHGVGIAQVANAVRNSNLDVGARTLEINSVEYLVRGLGFVKSLGDLESAVVVARENTPIRVRDVGRVSLGPSLRRGALDDEGAPAVGGVVVARFLENPLEVISRVKERIRKIAPGLPQRTLEDGTVSKVSIVPFYDRTVLINETLGTLSTALYQQILITLIVVLIMLRNLRSSVLITLLLPLGVLGAFTVMKVVGVDANVMALGGIAIAIGTMVDINIVFVENISQHLAQAKAGVSRMQVVRDAAAEVAAPVLTSVLTTVVSFLPVLGLTSTELRLFAPLAFTKTFAMLVALVLAVIVLPALSLLVLRKHPTSVTAKAGSRLPVLLQSALRREHVRDWLLLVAGVCVLSFHVVLGVCLLLLGLYRLLRPQLGPRWVDYLGKAEQVGAILVVTGLLSLHWLPLGVSAGPVVNVLFVGALVIGSMAAFTWFASSYPRLLPAILRHKLRFAAVPVGLVLFGASVWLGIPALTAGLPGVLKESGPLKAAAAAFPGLGREYMPPFDEGSFLYMPSTMPHASIGEGMAMLSEMDAAIAQIPEVDRVVGKLGRADTALDPAPISMIETVVTYHPEYGTDDDGKRYRQWRPHIRSAADIWKEIAKAGERPGLTSAPTLMPINARIIMLQSGMRSPMGIKIHGPSLEVIEAFGLKLEAILKTVSSVRTETVFADRVVGKPYLEIELDREAIGRFGLTIVDVQRVLQLALGGMTLTRTVEGRERYPVRVRYMREERDSIEALDRVFIPAPSGAQIPLGQLAVVNYVRGPQMIKAEDTFLTSYVLFDRTPETPEVEAVELAQAVIQEHVDAGHLQVPAGVSFEFSGTYENQVRSEKRLMLLVPLALLCVFVLLYLQFHRVSTAAIVYAGVLVAVSGGFMLLWLYAQPWFLDFSVFGTGMRDLFQVHSVNLSVAVWIGFIALIGIATDDGVIMSTYLGQRFAESPPTTVDEARKLTLEAGMRRVRPCLMTTATTILALLPVVTTSGRGADVMIPMALPAVGGMAIELVTLFVVPVLFCAREEWRLRGQNAGVTVEG